MIPTTHQLSEGRRPLALLDEGRERKLHRLTNALWHELREVRRSKSPIALHRALSLSKEIQRLGMVLVIFGRGEILQASDPRFEGRAIDIAPIPTNRPIADLRLGLKEQFAQLPLEEQEKLLREIRLRLHRSKETQNVTESE